MTPNDFTLELELLIDKARNAGLRPAEIAAELDLAADDLENDND